MPEDDTGQTAPSKVSRPTRRFVLVVVLACLVIGALIYGVHWWTIARFVESTDDAYLRADQVTVSPRVSGNITTLLVRDNQAVNAGDLLVKVDPASYLVTLHEREATVRVRQADIAVSQLQARQKLNGVGQSAARLAGDESNLQFATAQVERYRALSASGAETAEKLAQLRNQRDQARAARDADAAALAAMKRDSEAAILKMSQAQGELDAARAAVDTAQLDLDHTDVRSPISGRIGDRAARIGQYVQAGTRLMTIVPTRQIYVIANFKETQIGAMRAGQAAHVSVDALDGQELDAVLDSFAPGTGAQFALLPADNATGNFTKIVQRVPVRLRLRVDQATMERLVAGMSATVSINTAQKAGNADR